MPAITSLVLTDRESTPVDRTFVPINKDQNGVWTLEQSGASSPISAPVLTISAGRIRADKYRARIVLRHPTVQDETINGVTVPKVGRTGFGEVSFTFSSSSTEQERKNVIGMLRSALDADELIDGALIGMASFY